MPDAGTNLNPATHVAAAGVALLACTGGPERPKRLASASKGAKLLAAADGRVSWVRGKTVSWWDPARGEARDLALEGADWASPAGVAADASGLFFVHRDRLEHLQIPREGTKAFVHPRTSAWCGVQHVHRVLPPAGTDSPSAFGNPIRPIAQHSKSRASTSSISMREGAYPAYPAGHVYP